jgi:hypothetical protein
VELSRAFGFSAHTHKNFTYDARIMRKEYGVDIYLKNTQQDTANTTLQFSCHWHSVFQNIHKKSRN